MNSTSPLEFLGAFAVAFVAGAVATVAVQQWTKYLKENKNG